MKRFVFTLLIVLLSSRSHSAGLPFVEVSGDPSVFTYHPIGNSIHGIPISKIDSSWCAAELLSLEKFPAEVANNIKQHFSYYDNELANVFKSSKLGFTSPRFSAGRYKYLLASAGVYQQCNSDQTGIFLIVVNFKDRGKPQLIFNESIPDASIATVRLFPGKYIMVNWCFACDNASRFWFKNGKFQQIPSEEHYDE